MATVFPPRNKPTSETKLVSITPATDTSPMRAVSYVGNKAIDAVDIHTNEETTSQDLKEAIEEFRTSAAIVLTPSQFKASIETTPPPKDSA